MIKCAKYVIIMNLWFKLFTTAPEGQDYAQTQILQGNLGALELLVYQTARSL